MELHGRKPAVLEQSSCDSIDHVPMFFTSFSASVTHLLHVAHFSASDVATRSSSSLRSWPSETRQTVRRVQYPLIHCAVGPASTIHAFCSESQGESLWARPRVAPWRTIDTSITCQPSIWAIMACPAS